MARAKGTGSSGDGVRGTVYGTYNSTAGRALYILRVAFAELPFAPICRIMGLDRFTLRSRKKVNIQCNLFCIVHNLKKAARYGPELA